MYMCTMYMQCLQRPEESIISHWDLYYRQLWSIVSVLWIELKFSGRATIALITQQSLQHPFLIFDIVIWHCKAPSEFLEHYFQCIQEILLCWVFIYFQEKSYFLISSLTNLQFMINLHVFVYQLQICLLLILFYYTQDYFNIYEF